MADAWQDVKVIHGTADRVLAGPQLSYQLQNVPEHLAMVYARYRAAAALIGDAPNVMEIGCGEGIGVGILSKGRRLYHGLDNDAEAVSLADQQHRSGNRAFTCHDILSCGQPALTWDAAVALDVIEHIPAEREDDFMEAARSIVSCTPHGVCVIGTPNAAAYHLASDPSKAGHINNFSHDRLYELMRRYFHRVQSFGMNDVALHLGHPEMRHYLMMAGIGPKECQAPEGSFA